MEGIATQVSAEESDAYFRSRPEDSRRGAHASDQSAVIRNREALERRMAEVEKLWSDRDVPRPEHWGGYRIAPSAVEFWQGPRQPAS